MTIKIQTRRGIGKDSRYVLHRGAEEPYRDFPDVKVAQEVLNRSRLQKEARNFRKLTAIRNGLPLIHGKVEDSGSTSASIDLVKDEDISKLIDILVTLSNNYSSKAG